MGSRVSYAPNHWIEINENVRSTQLQLLLDSFPLDEEICVYPTAILSPRGTYIFRFAKGIAQLSLCKSSFSSVDSKITTVKMKEPMLKRMEMVLGMSNYCRYLRNGEHVVNYICTGRWFSMQMQSNQKLIRGFQTQVANTGAGVLVNKPPVGLTTWHNDYRDLDLSLFISENEKPMTLVLRASSTSAFIDDLVIASGCRGAPSGDGNSVLLRSMAELDFRLYQTDDSCILDAIGFLHGLMNAKESHALWTHRVLTKLLRVHNLVVVMSSLSRISMQRKQAINQWIKWFGMRNQRIQFIFTEGEYRNESSKNSIKKQLVSMLNLPDEIHISFHPFHKTIPLDPIFMKNLSENYGLSAPISLTPATCAIQ